MNLKGKVALVTGGTRGIGRAISLKLAEMGADLAINFFKSRQKAAETQKEIQDRGRKCITIRANMADHEGIHRMFRDVEKEYGRLDILIANAAMGMFGHTTQLTLKDWNVTLDANARALFLCAQEAYKLMQNKGGKIVTITSYGSQRYIPGYAALGASKAAMETLVKYLAVEFAPKKIIINCVSGGPVDTDSLRMIPHSDVLVNESVKRTPLGRIGTPEDLAKVVAFLCTPDSDWICGQVIVADGGVSLV